MKYHRKNITELAFLFTAVQHFYAVIVCLQIFQFHLPTDTAIQFLNGWNWIFHSFEINNYALVTNSLPSPKWTKFTWSFPKRSVRAVVWNCKLNAIHSRSWCLMNPGASIKTAPWPANGDKKIKGRIIILNCYDLNLIKLASQTLRTGHYWCAWRTSCDLSEHKVFTPFKLQRWESSEENWCKNMKVWHHLHFTGYFQGLHWGLFWPHNYAVIYHWSQKGRNCAPCSYKNTGLLPRHFVGVLYFLKSHFTLMPRKARN